MRQFKLIVLECDLPNSRDRVSIAFMLGVGFT